MNITLPSTTGDKCLKRHSYKLRTAAQHCTAFCCSNRSRFGFYTQCCSARRGTAFCVNTADYGSAAQCYAVLRSTAQCKCRFTSSVRINSITRSMTARSHKQLKGNTLCDLTGECFMTWRVSTKYLMTCWQCAKIIVSAKTSSVGHSSPKKPTYYGTPLRRRVDVVIVRSTRASRAIHFVAH